MTSVNQTTNILNSTGLMIKQIISLMGIQIKRFIKMALSLNLQSLLSDADEDLYHAQANFQFVKWWRIAVMTLSSGLLILNIFLIIRSKQYIYNTLKLFLFLQIFTLAGQFIVIFHPLINPIDPPYFLDNKDIESIIQLIIGQHGQNWTNMILCSVEAYLNLVFYNISYLFAILITLYVRKVIDNTHKYFMKKHINLIIYVTIATLLVYVPPFILSFFPNMPYSFGPVGFQIYDSVLDSNSYLRDHLFYCGITNRSGDGLGIAFSIINMMLIPVLMFVIHSILLYKNRKSIKFLKALEQLNPRQWFILKSGSLSTFVFIFQFFNFVKYVISLFTSGISFLILLVGFCNMIFDFMPIFLVFFYYKRYYKKGKKLQQKSLVRTTHTQSFDTAQIINF